MKKFAITIFILLITAINKKCYGMNEDSTYANQKLFFINDAHEKTHDKSYLNLPINTIQNHNLYDDKYQQINKEISRHQAKIAHLLSNANNNPDFIILAINNASKYYDRTFPLVENDILLYQKLEHCYVSNYYELAVLFCLQSDYAKALSWIDYTFKLTFKYSSNNKSIIEALNNLKTKIPLPYTQKKIENQNNSLIKASISLHEHDSFNTDNDTIKKISQDTQTNKELIDSLTNKNIYSLESIRSLILVINAYYNRLIKNIKNKQCKTSLKHYIQYNNYKLAHYAFENGNFQEATALIKIFFQIFKEYEFDQMYKKFMTLKERIKLKKPCNQFTKIFLTQQHLSVQDNIITQIIRATLLKKDILSSNNFLNHTACLTYFTTIYQKIDILLQKIPDQNEYNHYQQLILQDHYDLAHYFFINNKTNFALKTIFTAINFMWSSYSSQMYSPLIKLKNNIKLSLLINKPLSLIEDNLIKKIELLEKRLVTS